MKGQDIGEIRMIPRIQIRPFADQPRTFFDPDALEALKRSIVAVTQRVPILVKPIEPSNGHKYELIDGQRRWHACEMGNIKEMKCLVITPSNADQQYLSSVISNFCRENHTIPETVYAIKRVREMDGGKTLEQVAEIFGKSMTWVVQHLSLLKLEPEVFALLQPSVPEENRLSLTTALSLVKVPADLQVDLAKNISTLSLSMNQARNLIIKAMHRHGVKRPLHKPGREFSIIASMIERTHQQLNSLVDMPETYFKDAFRYADLQKRMRMIEALGENVDMLKMLEQLFRKIESEKKPDQARRS